MTGMGTINIISLSIRPLVVLCEQALQGAKTRLFSNNPCHLSTLGVFDEIAPSIVHLHRVELCTDDEGLSGPCQRHVHSLQRVHKSNVAAGIGLGPDGGKNYYILLLALERVDRVYIDVIGFFPTS